MRIFMISNKLVMPEHINPFGSLFGGTMMSWMDKLAAMTAIDHTKRNCVTASVSRINFFYGAKVGDRVNLEAKVVEEGNSSLKIEVHAKCNNFPADTTISCATAEFIFVAIGEDGKSDSSWHHHLEA